MLRLFVGIEFPPELKLRLSLLSTVMPGARWVDAGNFHLTLRFIGEVGRDVAADIDEALGRLRARRFTLQLAGTGVFGGDRPRALWVGVEREPELVSLHGKIEQALIRIGLDPEPRKFVPHVTLARLRDASNQDVADYLSVRGYFPTRVFTASRFVLFSSRASTGGGPYVVEDSYALSA